MGTKTHIIFECRFLDVARGSSGQIDCLSVPPHGEIAPHKSWEGGREGGREQRREGEREGIKEGGREEGR